MTLGVRIIVINQANQICLVRHSYVEGWYLPGGGVEKGESIYDAAIKELHEEARIIAKPENLKLVSLHANKTNFKGDHVALFVIEDFQETDFHPTFEILEQGFFDLKDLPNNIEKSNHARILEYFKLRPFSDLW